MVWKPTSIVQASLLTALLLFVATTPPVAASTHDCCDRYGTIVHGTDEDVGLPLFASFASMGFLDDDGNSWHDPGEALVLDLQNDGTLNVGDLLLYETGRTIRASDPRFGDPVTPLGAAFAFDAGFWSGGAFAAYADADGSGTVTDNDARITASPGGAAGTRVMWSDADVGNVLYWMPSPGGLDLDGDGFLEAGEPLYAHPWGSYTVHTGSVRMGGVETVTTAHPAVLETGTTRATLVLSATLLDAAGDPLRGRTVDFRVGSETVCTSVTGADGTAICTGPVALAKAVAQVGYTASFVGQGYYHGSAGTGSLVA